MRRLFALAVVAGLAAVGLAADEKKKGTEVELGGLKATAPAEWKAKDLAAGSMRKLQLTVPKSEGDKEDGEIALFEFPGGSGSVKDNLARQVKKFQPAEGKDAVEEKTDTFKIGDVEATIQDVKGTFIKKPFPMAEKGDPMPNWRQVYVVFETKDGKQCYLWLLGPAKTVEDNKKAFEEMVKGMKK